MGGHGRGARSVNTCWNTDQCSVTDLDGTRLEEIVGGGDMSHLNNSLVCWVAVAREITLRHGSLVPGRAVGVETSLPYYRKGHYSFLKIIFVLMI